MTGPRTGGGAQRRVNNAGQEHGAEWSHCVGQAPVVSMSSTASERGPCDGPGPFGKTTLSEGGRLSHGVRRFDTARDGGPHGSQECQLVQKDEKRDAFQVRRTHRKGIGPRPPCLGRRRSSPKGTGCTGMQQAAAEVFRVLCARLGKRDSFPRSRRSRLASRTDSRPFEGLDAGDPDRHWTASGISDLDPAVESHTAKQFVDEHMRGSFQWPGGRPRYQRDLAAGGV